MKVANICYIINEEGEILLQKKARGFGVGKWNGPGGKSELGEQMDDAVRREVKEETTLELGKLNFIAHMFYQYGDDAENGFETYIYSCYDYTGEPFDTGEGELKWFKKSEIPLDDMWDDDKYWLLAALDGEFKEMHFIFDEDGKVLKYNNI